MYTNSTGNNVLRRDKGKMMEKKPGFIYKYSEILRQNIALSRNTGWLYCEDGTKYSPREVECLRQTQTDTPVEVHILKHVFDGVIVSAGD